MRIEEEDTTESNEVVLNELRSMIIQTLNFPLPTPSSQVASSSTSKRQYSSSWWTTLLSTSPQDSPATFAALFLGISVAFMIFGSAIFLVGLLMFPWVILILMLFYLSAFLSNVSFFARFFLASVGIALAQGSSST